MARDMLAWQTVETCQGCGWVVRWPGPPRETRVECGKCGAAMKVEKVQVLTDAEVALVLEFVGEWPTQGCANCGTTGRHHVRERGCGAGGWFLYCRRCGDELMEVDVERIRRSRSGEPPANGD